MTITEHAPFDQLPRIAIARPKPRRWPWTIARIAGGALGIVTLIAASGAAYEAFESAADAAAHAPAGRLVDAGGYKLHLDCRGAGSPTVVLDAGLGGSALDWSLVQPELARRTTVCSYDRAGMGSSEPGPEPRSPAHLAEELHKLLQNGGVAGPYVLVGHSLAGKTVRMFAHAYPAETAGMVLVDARSEAVEASSDMTMFATALEGQATVYSLARRFGIARLFGAGLVGEPLVPPALATRMVLAETETPAIAETTAEGLARTADDQVLAAASLGSLPLVVVAAGDSLRGIPGWPEAQRLMARLSTRGKLLVAGNSSHAIHLAEPTVIIDAISGVVDAVRAGN